MKKKILSIGLALLLLGLVALPALASVDKLHFIYALDPDDWTITKVKGTFYHLSTDYDRDCVWGVECDLSKACEIVYGYDPERSDTGWFIGVAKFGQLWDYSEIEPLGEYDYLITVDSGWLELEVKDEYNTVVYEWEGYTQREDKSRFGFIGTSNEIITWGSEGKFGAVVVHSLKWVYDENTSDWYNAQEVMWSPSSWNQSTDYLELLHDENLYYGDTCVVHIGEALPYDADNNGIISKSEALVAVADYFNGDITKAQVLEVIALYFNP